ncbi:MAG: hypothetical protein HY898_11580 [Deltaproteobacteria bacterium]|nr:hypothetical protein [Deltaproteobacteria bacterium]
MSLRAGFLGLAAIVIAVGCGGSVETTNDPGASGSGGAAGAGGSSGKGGTGGVVIDAGPDVKPDAPFKCGKTSEHFTMNASLYDGRTFGCGFGKDTGSVQLKGRIESTTADSFTLDSCPPDMDCMPMYSTISIPGSYPLLLGGGFVTLYLEVDQPWGCAQRMLLMSLPIWGGEPNPNGGGTSMIFAGADGTYETFPDSPFQINPIGLGCYPGAGSCGGEPTDDYVLRFVHPSDATEVTVAMGEMQSWMWSNEQPGYWAVHNLRSYSSGACDDYWNWAYRITMQGIK